VLGPLVALVAVAWVALIIGGPLVPGFGGAVLYGLGSFICHQIPERSFHIGGIQMPVCARCLGLYAGAALGVVGHLRVWHAGRITRALTTPRTARWLALVAAGPTVLTVVLEMAGLWQPANLTRALAGLPLGGVVALVVMGARATLHYDGCVLPRSTVPNRPPPPI
jgi:uncharacterized membrane protein